MKKIKWIKWACLVIGVMVIIFMIVKNEYFLHANPTVPEVKGFKFARHAEVIRRLSAWGNHKDGVQLLAKARSIVRYDFLFIFCYAIVLIGFSNAEMYRQKDFPLNNLLRFSMPLTVLVVVLNFLQDLSMLFAINHWKEDHWYYSTWYLSLPKFIIAGWIVLVLLVSVIYRLAGKR